MRNIASCSMAVAIIVFLGASSVAVTAQDKDGIGGNWSNPAGASIGSMINDQLANRMRARAKAKEMGSAPTGTDARKKTPAEIDAAVRFRSTGTQLRAQAFVDFLSEGGTPETKTAMAKIVSTLLTEYEKAARQQGKPNDLALAVTAALVYNSSIYSGTSDPDDASIMEIRDSVAELAVEDGTFAAMNDRQKQELYENLVISTLLAKAGYEEARDKGDKATMATYRELAGQTLTAVSGLPPDKIRFMPDAETIEALRRASAPSAGANGPTSPAGAQNTSPPTVSDADYLDFDPFPDKPHVQPQKPLLGRIRKSITTADLAGKWQIGGANVTSYFNSSSGNYSSTDTTFSGEWYTIRADGTFDSQFQGRTSNHTVRESDSGTIVLEGGFITFKYKQKPAMRYQFVTYMDAPKGAAVLTLIYIGDNAPLSIETLRAGCAHAYGWVTCTTGEEFVRIP